MVGCNISWAGYASVILIRISTTLLYLKQGNCILAYVRGADRYTSLIIIRLSFDLTIMFCLVFLLFKDVPESIVSPQKKKKRKKDKQGWFLMIIEIYLIYK